MRIYYYRRGSAALKMGPEAFDPDYLNGAAFLHLTGITPALSADCRALVLWAAQQARASRARVSFDVNYRSTPWTAAEAVGDTGGDAGEALDRLGTLVEQSLVTVDPDTGGETRYGMLEPVRQYAAEKLEQSEIMRARKIQSPGAWRLPASVRTFRFSSASSGARALSSFGITFSPSPVSPHSAPPSTFLRIFFATGQVLRFL